jgi:U3 small nucleolar RNA-associated protein 10
VRTLRGELESLSELPERVQAAHEARLACAALRPLRALSDQLASTDRPPPSPLLKQALLAAAGASAAAFGRLRPEAVSGCVPALLTCARDASPAVRGSALLALAQAAAALGGRIVPHLPAAMAALLECASGAAARLSCAASDGAAADAPPAGSGDEPAAELASALAALSSMLDALGALLSPYLRDALRLLLSPACLLHTTPPTPTATGGTPTGGVAASAASVRTWLPSVIPARLLLEPLFAQLPRCIEQGPQSTQALLALVASATERLDTKAAATYSEQVFLFLLRVLDVRALRPPSLSGQNHLHDVEVSALACLVALTMKLTESRFKPLFLRLLEWAQAADGPAAGVAGAALGRAAAGTSSCDAPGGGGGGCPRQVVLFGAAAALTGRLRSVFVPYFRYLLDPAVVHLSGNAAGGHKKKKRRASSSTGGGGGVGGGGGEAEWLLRMRVLRALHRGLLHDGGGFFDAEKLERLLPPLVAQLEAVPPTGVLRSGVLSRQCSDAELDGYIHAGRAGSAAVDAYDAHGVAAAAALVQLGVTANSDVFWKPLNYRVLMVTRNQGSVRARLLALEVSSRKEIARHAVRVDSSAVESTKHAHAHSHRHILTISDAERRYVGTYRGGFVWRTVHVPWRAKRDAFFAKSAEITRLQQQKHFLHDSLSHMHAHSHTPGRVPACGASEGGVPAAAARDHPLCGGAARGHRDRGRGARAAAGGAAGGDQRGEARPVPEDINNKIQ